ncbi:MAG TPA: hypothetical protein VHQ86_00485 [Candidatus Saccharimonadia bacterium]|jgi:predicted negative regulator of RcsB-dependent stress response|nr:hypothetical protein [Candidatus Saccharimonadia bacterium]
MKKQQGFAAFEVVLVLVIVGVIGFTAWNYWSNHSSQVATESATAQVTPAPQITSTTDLTSAENDLDSVNIDASTSDSSQLDSQLNNF